jgi:putative ABC transport system substrate-binding protein
VKRRAFITLLGGAAAWPVAAHAQQPDQLQRIGFLASGAATRFVDALKEGLRALGHVEGQRYTLELRNAGSAYDRLAGLAAELIALKVNVIVAAAVPSALAAKHATGTIPIVAAAVGDPVGAGLVSNLARPEGNVTGLSHFAADLSGKQVDLFKQAIPGLTRIGVLYNPTNLLHPTYWRETETAAHALGATLVRVDAHDKDELVHAFPVARARRDGGIIVLADPFFNLQNDEIAKLAVEAGLPLMSPYREDAEAGALLTYGPSLLDIFRRAAVYVDKLLWKGAKPSDLPVEQPTKFELVLNLKTAKALGIEVPPTLLVRADEVIE